MSNSDSIWQELTKQDRVADAQSIERFREKALKYVDSGSVSLEQLELCHPQIGEHWKGALFAGQVARCDQVPVYEASVDGLVNGDSSSTMLSDHCAKRGDAARFTVLNFGSFS
jgi:hypothetical protein